MTDEELWTKRVEQMFNDLKGGNRNLDQNKYSEHPGMPVVLAACFGKATGMSAKEGLKLSVAIINALVITGAAWWAKKIIPDSFWWVGVWGMVLFNPLYYHASPTDAVAAPLTVIIFLMAWRHLKKRKKVSLASSLVLGLLMGVGLATRLHFFILFLAPLFVFLIMANGLRRVLIIGLSGLVWMQALNVLAWYSPINFFRAALFGQLGFYTGSSLNDMGRVSVQFVDFLLFGPLALWSIFLAVFIMLIPEFKRIVERGCLLVLFISTLISVSFLLGSSLQSLRYFYPLFFLWEAFLPLWLLLLASKIKLSSASYGLQKITRKRKIIGPVLVGGLIISQAFMMIYTYYLPAREYLVDWQRVSKEITKNK